MRHRDMFQKKLRFQVLSQKVFTFSGDVQLHQIWERRWSRNQKRHLCSRIEYDQRQGNDSTIVFFPCFMFIQCNVPNMPYASHAMCQTCLCSGLCNPLALALHPYLRWVEQVAKILIVSVPWICLDTSFKSHSCCWEDMLLYPWNPHLLF